MTRSPPPRPHPQMTERDRTDRPSTPEGRSALYRYVRSELAARLGKDPHAHQVLSLAAVRHAEGQGSQIFLRGPAGSGKTHLIREFASVAASGPYSEVPAAVLSEQGWRGGDLSFYLYHVYRDLMAKHDPMRAQEIAERAIILVDDLDHARLAGAYSSASAQDHRKGRQATILSLLTGAPVPVGTERGDGGWIWRGSRALIIVAGRFPELGSGVASAEDLVAWGMIPPLAERIATMSSVTLERRSRDLVNTQTLTACVRAIRQFRSYGYNLDVSPSLVGYAETRMEAMGYTPGPTELGAWIGAAAERLLAKMLDEVVPVGTDCVLAPDDLLLPKQTRGIWRE